MRGLLCAASAALGISSAAAATVEIQPGEYVRERDTGTLTIRRDEQKGLVFEIEAVGGNCHSCRVSGVIRGATGHADSWAPNGRDSNCDIAFSSSGSALAVRPTTAKECRPYCGARASFDGTYAVPAANCTSAARQEQRDRFLVLYRAKQFRQAAGTLEALIAQCGEFMGWLETDSVRNDLALSQYHDGRPSRCLQTLEATVAVQFKDEAGLKERWHLPPCDFDNYVDVARATWHNQALCTKSR